MADKPDLDELARRYLDLWQDQVATLAQEAQFADALSRLTAAAGPAGTAASTIRDFWQAAMAIVAEAAEERSGSDGSDEGGVRATVSAAKAGASPVTAPPGGSHVDLGELSGRLAALEERVSALEASPRGRGRRAAKTPRKRKS